MRSKYIIKKIRRKKTSTALHTLKNNMPNTSSNRIAVQVILTQYLKENCVDGINKQVNSLINEMADTIIRSMKNGYK